MTLAQALMKIAAPASNLGIWANSLDPDTEECRIGQTQFDNGGFSDGWVLVATGDEWQGQIDSFWNSFTEKERHELEEFEGEEGIAKLIFYFAKEEGYLKDAERQLETRGVFNLDERGVDAEIETFGEDIDYTEVVNPDDISDFSADDLVSIGVKALIAKSNPDDEETDIESKYQAWKSVYPWQYEDAIKHAVKVAAEHQIKKIMTAGEVVETFDLSESTVRVAISRGQIPALKSGGTWLVLRKDAISKWGSN